MGKLNRRINAKLGKEKKILTHKTGLSNSLLSKKTSLTELTADSVAVVKNFKAAPKPEDKVPATTAADFSKFVSNQQTKKFIKKKFQTENKSKISKKEKMQIRRSLLTNKLAGEAAAKQEKKEKKVREKTVIVKDIKPLLDDLLDIEEEIIKKDELHQVKKKKKKMSKSTLKEKKRQEEFHKNIQFFKEALKHPAYVKDPLNTISTHINNSVLKSGFKDKN